MIFLEILEILNWQEKDEKLFKKIFDEFEQEGKIVRIKCGRFGFVEEMNLFVGVFEVNLCGYGFLIFDNFNIFDIYIFFENMNGVMYGDRVFVKVFFLLFVEGKKVEGFVERIL